MTRSIHVDPREQRNNIRAAPSRTPRHEEVAQRSQAEGHSISGEKFPLGNIQILMENMGKNMRKHGKIIGKSQFLMDKTWETHTER